MDAPAAAPAASASASEEAKPGTCIIVVGLAGSGKSSLTQRIITHAYSRGSSTYAINLDPAVERVATAETDARVEEDEEDEDDGLAFNPNIDIRDSVEYREILTRHGLGPNGGIMTCLNLFASRFDQVTDIVAARSKQVDYVFVDTPGQVEVFTWSASGAIITESLASLMPTVLVFVVDTVRSKAPATFCSNMLFACSVMFRTKLPMILCFNKVDVEPHDFAVEWLSDFSAFQDAIYEHDQKSADGGDFMSSLTGSLALVLEEFYHTLDTVGVSAATGEGMEEFFAAVDRAAEEYKQTYLPEIEERRRQHRREEEQASAAPAASSASPSSKSGAQPASKSSASKAEASNAEVSNSNNADGVD